MSAEPQQQLQPASLAVKKLERVARSTRAEFNQADAALHHARADHRLKPSHSTLEAQDLAERDRRRARAAWLKAVDDLEVARTGGK